jgi:DNA-binding transcriptional LysR family regulator
VNQIEERRKERLSRQLDWNLLRTFMVIVQEGSITRAAERLLLKQPSVSSALKRLETQLARQLIERGPSIFRVTPAGDLLYRECVEIYGSVSRLAVLLRDVHDEISGHITISLASHVVCPTFDEVLSRFHQEHPKVTYALEIDTSAVVVESVLQKRASLGICLVHDKDPRLPYLHLYREFFGFFCGPRHRFFGRSDLQLTDLRGEPNVSFKTDQLSDALRPVALLRERHDLQGPIIGTSSNLEEVRRMIIGGLGIGPLPLHVMTRDQEAGLLWRLPPYEDPPVIDIYMVYNPRAHLNRAERHFIEALQDAVAATPLEERTYVPERANG